MDLSNSKARSRHSCNLADAASKSGKQEAVLIDFGLARQFSIGEALSMTNDGTEGYTPIEQYSRKGNFGAYTDVYALAATLYFLLTGDAPKAADEEVVTPFRRKYDDQQLPPPKEYNPHISDRVNEAILKGMELEPQDRPQTVREWLALLPFHEDIEINGEIVILGPRPSGKVTFLTTLAYFLQFVYTSPINSVFIDNEDLFYSAEYVLKKGYLLPPPETFIETFFSMTIEPKLNLSKIERKENVKLDFNCILCPGELFEALRDPKMSSLREEGKWTAFISKCTSSKRLALMISTADTSRDQEIYQAITLLERELHSLITSLDKQKTRIATIFSCFDRPEAWCYRNNLEKFTSLKFPKTQKALQNWSYHWRCSVAYFACSAFGMVGNPPVGNAISYDSNCCFSGGLAQPDAWKPFGLVEPIYWLLTGEYDERIYNL